MKAVSFFLLSLVSASAFADAPVGGNISVGVGKDNVPVYYAVNAEGQMVEVSSDFVTESVANATSNARKMFCSSRLRPESVSVRVGVLSVNWSMNTLCKAK